MNDSQLFEAFEAGVLPGKDLGHRAHLRLAFLYLRRAGDFGAGAQRFREALRRFTEIQGVPHKFHETLTWAYLALVGEAMDGCRDESSEHFVDRSPLLLDHFHGALSKLYDVAAITADDRARRILVFPRRA